MWSLCGHFVFLHVTNVLENSGSANSETITTLFLRTYKSVGFGLDGANVMVGARNGVRV